MNLTYGSLEDVPLKHIAYLLAESIASKDKSSRFLDLARFAENLSHLKHYFTESVKVPDLLKQRQFENISKKPDGISWSEFVGQILQISSKTRTSSKLIKTVPMNF